MKQIFLVLAIFTFGIASSQNLASFFKQADDVFSTFVVDSKVNYEAIKADPQLLNAALAEAKGVSVNTSSPKTYQAFWINTYNLLVIKGVVDNYPTKSPLDNAGFFDKTTYTVGGTTVTLNDIENKLLRAKFPNEPRFHFVLVCGALSCPPIINKAYSPNYLEAQLEQQTNRALNDPIFMKVSGNNVQFSKIMDWYNEDFTRNGQTLIAFANKYRKDKIPADAKTSFYEYDWSLNETKKKITKVPTVPEKSTTTSDGKEDAMKKEGTAKAATVSTSAPKKTAVDSEPANTTSQSTSEVVVTAIPKKSETPEVIVTAVPKADPSTKINYDNVGDNDMID